MFTHSAYTMFQTLGGKSHNFLLVSILQTLLNFNLGIVSEMRTTAGHYLSERNT